MLQRIDEDKRNAVPFFIGLGLALVVAVLITLYVRQRLFTRTQPIVLVS